jgi:hypothetical protein
MLFYEIELSLTTKTFVMPNAIEYLLTNLFALFNFSVGTTKKPM